MKNVFMVLISVFLFSMASAQTTQYYTCPMHPEVRSDKAGKCPKCGMDLVKKTVKAKPAKPASNKRPDKVKTEAPPAREHKAHITDTARPAQPAAKLSPGEPGMVYTCVMHPEVKSGKPGSCPKCGMTLVKKPVKGNDDKMDEKGPAGVDIKGHHHEGEKDSADIPAVEMIGNSVNLERGKTVTYHLYVTDTMVNFTGKMKHAYAINGQLPAPALYFTEGDTAEIYLHNKLEKEETSLHWHGVILPNRFDGVPYLTTARIGPGETHLYKFRVVQNGTYWYHSHSALQEQQGMYGALIFKKSEQAGQLNAGISPDGHSLPAHLNLVLSDWSDEDPDQTQRRFRTGNDWFSIKKGSTQSYVEAAREGHLKTKFVNEWKRMKAMDVSDNWYQRFLVNGNAETKVASFKAGDRVNLHVVNAGASSYFWLGYAGGKITVAGNDGNELQPIEVDRLIIAPAETFDLIVTIPENMSYEFRATSEDRTGASSLWLGSGMKMPAPKLPRLKYFEGMKMMNAMMNTNGSMKDMSMNMSLQQMDMNMVMYPEITGGEDDSDTSASSQMEMQHAAPGKKDTTQHSQMEHMQHEQTNGMDHTGMNSGAGIVTLNYAMMKARYNTALPDGPMKILRFQLTGNMNRYVWTLDNKTVNEADRILVQKGENVRLILTNNSMMRHPMHLHGHDFRVVNGQGDYAPLKNVLDIMPMETDTIEFAANQEGNWFFHCHILFHMMAGMGRVFTYENSPVNPELPDTKKAYKMFKKDNTMRHLMARIGLESNGSDGEAMLSSNRYALQGLWHLGLNPHHGHETEVSFGKYIGVNQWFFPYVGFDFHYKKKEDGEAKMADDRNMFGQVSNKNNRSTYTIGFQYTTPWLLLADARVDGNGKFRFQVSREDIPVTPRLRLNFMANTDKEYMTGLRYVLTKWIALSTHYDSDMGPGAGVTITY